MKRQVTNELKLPNTLICSKRKQRWLLRQAVSLYDLYDIQGGSKK